MGGRISNEADRLKVPWRQCVLSELQLFDRIITERYAGAEGILEGAKYLLQERNTQASNGPMGGETKKGALSSICQHLSAGQEDPKGSSGCRKKLCREFGKDRAMAESRY